MSAVMQYSVSRHSLTDLKYGLGSMGLGMATNLQKHLASATSGNLLYCNRSMNKGEPLKALGAKPEPDFGRLVQQSDIVFTMVL